MQKSEGRIINFLHSGNESSLIFGVQKDKVFFGYRDENKKYKRSNYSFDYGKDEWHHVVISYANSEFNVYLDSDPLASVQDSFYGFGPAKGTLGSYKLSSSVFVGDIDEISSWKTALSSQAVKKLYNDGIFSDLKLHPNHADVARWWRMGDKGPRHMAGEIIE